MAHRPQLTVSSLAIVADLMAVNRKLLENIQERIRSEQYKK